MTDRPRATPAGSLVAAPQLEVYSHARNRVFKRRFDHEEARRRYANGEAIQALAHEYGVTFKAVYFVVNPAARAANIARQKARDHVPCEVCGGPCLRVTHAAKRAYNHDGREICLRCRKREGRERFRFDDQGRIIAVRCTSLDCANGERWQKPSQFPGGTRFRDLRTKGFHSLCRSCNTRQKKRWRERTGAND